MYVMMNKKSNKTKQNHEVVEKVLWSTMIITKNNLMQHRTKMMPISRRLEIREQTTKSYYYLGR